MKAPARILLVEDDPLNARLLIRLFERRGFDVEHAADGLSGLSRARSGGFDLVVMDWLLPGLDGYRACSLLKRDQRFASLPLFVVTGKTEPEELDAMRAVGVEKVLGKQLEPVRIVEAVEEFLGTTTPNSPSSSTAEPTP